MCILCRDLLATMMVLDALAVAIPLYQILKGTMPEFRAPPAFFAEPSQTGVEMINGVLRFVQSM